MKKIIFVLIILAVAIALFMLMPRKNSDTTNPSSITEQSSNSSNNNSSNSENSVVKLNSVVDSISEFKASSFAKNLKVPEYKNLVALNENVAQNSTKMTLNSQNTATLEKNFTGNLSAILKPNESQTIVFEFDKDIILFSKLLSDNEDYSFQVYKISDNSSLETFSNSAKSNNAIRGTMPAGKYAFVVSNLGKSENLPYTLYLNTTVPDIKNIKSFDIVYVSDSYKYVATELIDTNDKSILYVNGTEIYNENKPQQLDWERVLDLKWNGGYNYSKHNIYDVKLKGISKPGIYTSDYVKSDNAVILFLDEGTGYIYNESKRSSDINEKTFHFNDPLGNKTPRKLTAEDIENNQCWLVFDLNTGKPIDFWSSLNWYYSTKTENASFKLKA